MRHHITGGSIASLEPALHENTDLASYGLSSSYPFPCGVAFSFACGLARSLHDFAQIEPMHKRGVTRLPRVPAAHASTTQNSRAFPARLRTAHPRSKPGRVPCGTISPHFSKSGALARALALRCDHKMRGWVAENRLECSASRSCHSQSKNRLRKSSPPQPRGLSPGAAR